MTIPEYNLLMEAARLKEIDKDYRNHLQAWLNRLVKAEKKSGRKTKPVYKKFKEFYDYEKNLGKVAKNDENKKSRFSGVGELLKKGVKENG